MSCVGKKENFAVLLELLQYILPVKDPFTDCRRRHSYKPLPVVIREGDGAWVTDPEGTLPNMMAGCSVLNLGHRHLDLTSAAQC